MPAFTDDEDLPLDAGAGKAAPERTCILNRRVGTPDSLLRFVVGPDGALVPDIKAKLPGRGAWLTPTRRAIEAAVKRKLFARAFRREVAVGADLPDLVDSLLEQQALNTLSLANKASAIITGFAKIEAAARGQGAGALIHAADAGADGVRKIAQALHSRHGAAAESIPRLTMFRSGQLDLALGRDNVVHALVLAVPPGMAFVERCKALAAYRTGDQSGGVLP